MSSLSRFSLVHASYNIARRLLTDPQCFSILAALVVFGDALLTQLIIRFVPYTEIDWETYMIQLELYMKGERDYALITGPTGPIVYPAGHIHVHRILYDLTDSGTNLWKGQQIYGALYLATLALSAATYKQAGSVPNWILLLLPISKRLHSIYVLRLFNDCWAVFAAQAATLAFANSWDALGILLLGCALSVKMCVLLYIPGLLVILFKRRGLVSTLVHMLALAATQIFIGLPFLMEFPKSYLKYSYEFSRVFLFKWTVNWRFLGEELFLSPAWAKGLLVGHITTLALFGLFKWCRSDGGVWNVLERGLRQPLRAPSAASLTADYVVTVLFTSNLIGIVFARSLHYQFYSWYAMQLPFLAWRTKYPIALRIALLLTIEYAWNVYPSTNFSSGVLVAANTALLLGIWFGYPEGKTVHHSSAKV
ncbi:glycosyltransferase family 58 protein [Lentinus tigrinus ALCF2SS1-7]|uniref:Dol-P-Man:Man(5)GlcNAc(2)-PP-Dol alpha-1,3-mannosyltransferase n=1 Tax=Lentinus tigrinus ALCF2SS1-6 TaxID=1328759 RepID=A0A5C2SQZ3_9APHY|nr:glycosyltransferase family 58 protein [Lentinus tigrinus ALCF2SS1-6]RPD80225.1 glycosyltransferase family 58 protein [Lentinus tigrinus ALCF2SS1-7]